MRSSGSKNSVTESGSIYLVDGERTTVEMERAIGISVMGVDGVGGGVFSFRFEDEQGSADLEDFKTQWLDWLREKFRDQLADTFVKVYTASSQMRIRQNLT